jgi:hypothetical protein
MNTRQLVFAGCAAMILSIGSAQAGPCNTGGPALARRPARLASQSLPGQQKRRLTLRPKR